MPPPFPDKPLYERFEPRYIDQNPPNLSAHLDASLEELLVGVKEGIFTSFEKEKIRKIIEEKVANLYQKQVN